MNRINNIKEINKQIKNQKKIYIDPLKKELDNEYTAIFNTFKGKAFLINTKTYVDKKWRHYYYFINKTSTTMCDAINFRICDIEEEDNKISELAQANSVLPLNTPANVSTTFTTTTATVNINSPKWYFAPYAPYIYNGFTLLTTINNKLCEEKEWVRRTNILSVYNKINSGKLEETEEIQDFIKYYNIREHL